MWRKSDSFCRFAKNGFKILKHNKDSLRGSSFRIGTIQRRLAWPLRKDDTHKSRSVNKILKKTNTRSEIPGVLVGTTAAAAVRRERILLYVCMYIYIYIHTHTHLSLSLYIYIYTHTYIYIYIYRERERGTYMGAPEERRGQDRPGLSIGIAVGSRGPQTAGPRLPLRANILFIEKEKNEKDKNCPYVQKAGPRPADCKSLRLQPRVVFVNSGNFR